MRLSLASTGLIFLGIAQTLCPFAEKALRDPEHLSQNLAERNLPAPARTEEIIDEERRSGPGGIPFTTFSKDQLIDVTGEHAWVAPGPGDLRGPCPGLNTLANHGYFPHNGVVPLAVGASATEEVYGQ